MRTLTCLLLAARAALASDAPLAVTEADLALLNRLEYARALAERRAFYDRASRAAYLAEAESAMLQAGWSQLRIDDVQGAMREALRAIDGGPAQAHPVTIETARAHLEELRRPPDLRARADEQVLAERAAAWSGTAPTGELLAGTWILDVAATIEQLAGALEPEAKDALRRSLEPRVAGTTFTFFAGMVEVTHPGETPPTVHAQWRLDGHRLYLREPDAKTEQQLDVGFKGAHLQIGRGPGVSLFRRRTLAD